MNDADETATAPGTGPDQGRQQNDIWQVALVVLVVLAVVAVVVMLFTGSDVALKISVVAALWAAVLGIILVARYRGQVAAVERERELAEREYEEDLRIETAVHREQEHILQQSYLESLDEYRDTALAEIREQLEAMRAQLEELSGQTWSYEPAALQAEARRIQELLAGPARAADDSGRHSYPGVDAAEAQAPVRAEPAVSEVSADGEPRDIRDVEEVEEVAPEDHAPVTPPVRSAGAADADVPAATGSHSPSAAAARQPEPAAGAPEDATITTVPPDGDSPADDAVDEEDTTGAFAPVSRPSWLTSPSALKPNPLITGGSVPGGGVPTDASYLIAGGSRDAEQHASSAAASGPAAEEAPPWPAATGADSSSHGAHGAHGDKGFDTGAMGTVPWDASGHSASRSAPHAAPPAGSPDERRDAGHDAEVPRHGRRRRDERGGGISVAELLENLRDNADDDQ
ncbi:hypothetical protein JIM95_010060 [Corynebacterium sp. CCM 8835]|uniref:DUF6779 domain-containing protein n=1 Tax=Corynebacterium antarcticum TaxID=2800405 RepID=A0ABS1FIZ2_9CORY|nr:DUF6779 domain-containing protein [Corynebacterium antarcticum]MCL0246474.1 hypothetical protein [Corynebacterium antarcticum]MCX7541210.1 hypothetical protein [Corynebacterium antarcticum]